MMVKKIMVVDDSPDVIFTLKHGLEDTEKNYEIIGVESGNLCLKLLKEDKLPDLILLDIMMPEMSGWETYDKLKENPLWKEIPIFFLTARTDRIAKSAGGFLGDDFIEKPFEIEDVKRRINKVLEIKL